MTDHREEFPNISDQDLSSSEYDQTCLGKNNADINLLRMTSPDKLLLTLEAIDAKNLWTEHRDFAYDIIDSSIGSKEERDQATLYLALEGVKWVSEKSYNKYPYKTEDLKGAAGYEISARISKGFRVLGSMAETMSADQDVMLLSVSLANELQTALVQGEEWSNLNEAVELDYDTQIMQERTAVYALSFLDSIKGSLAEDFIININGSSLAHEYIKQLSIFIGGEKENPLFEIYGDSLLEELGEMVDENDDTAIQDLLWIFDNVKYGEVGDRTSGDKLRNKVLNKSLGLVKKYELDARKQGAEDRKTSLRGFFNGPSKAEDKYEAVFLDLVQNLSDNFEYMIIKQPEYVSSFVGLQPRDKHTECWNEIGDKVVELCMGIDLSEPGAVYRISYLQAAFRALTNRKSVAKRVDQQINEWFSGQTY